MRLLDNCMNGFAMKTLVSGSALAACLSASAVSTYNLTPGGMVQLSAPSLLVDFNTEAPTLDATAGFSSLYRVQSEAPGQQEGFNASVMSGASVMADVERSPLGTVDVQLSHLGGQYIGVPESQRTGPVQMVVMGLDLDETAGGFSATAASQAMSCVSLDSFQVFVSDQPIRDASSYENLKNNARMVYDLDVDYSTGMAEDRSLLLKDGLDPNRATDLYVKIPMSLFEAAGATPNSYVYVYSKFGGVSGFEADRGYEQWTYVRAAGAPTVVIPPSVVPEASSWFAGAALTSLMAGAVWMRRRTA